MKKFCAISMAIALTTTAVLAGCGSKPAKTAPKSSSASASPAASQATDSVSEPTPEITWKPTQETTWVVTSKPGGGSDIYTHMISDIMTTEKMVDTTFLVMNKTDGGGEVGRLEVSQMSGKKADSTLLTFNSGDLMPMVENTPNRIENFTPIAVMAVDKQLLFVRAEEENYKDFKSILSALDEGKDIIMGGSKGDDVATYEALLAEIGASSEQFRYITHDGTGDAISALLGGHIDVLISKPAAADQYVEAGKIVPILALSSERYGDNLSDAPTLSEVDSKYQNVEVPVWRGVVGPKDMSLEAAQYWSEQLAKVSENQKWKDDYISKNKLISSYMSMEQAKMFMEDFEAEYLKSIGK